MMWQWFNKQKKLKPPTEPLIPPAIQTLIDQIQRLTGVTHDDFQSLYRQTLERFINYKTAPNQQMELALLSAPLKTVITALKKRQAYLLPQGADSEIAFRQREAWTFAVFTAALLKPLDVNSRCALAKAILPAQGYAWLHRHSDLFQGWMRYLHDDQRHNVFAEIIDATLLSDTPEPNTSEPQQQTALTASPPVASITTTSTMSAIKTKPLAPEQPSQQDQSLVTEDAVKVSRPIVKDQPVTIQEIDLATLTDNNDKETATVDTTSSNDDNHTQAVVKPMSVIKAADFWRWLRHGIACQTLSVNQTDSIIHGVDAGIFIQLPNAIDAFLQDHAKTHAISDPTQFMRQRFTLTKAIKKHTACIRQANGSRVYRYCIGKWQQRQVIAGLVIKPTALMDAGIKTATNANLTLDPIDNR